MNKSDPTVLILALDQLWRGIKTYPTYFRKRYLDVNSWVFHTKPTHLEYNYHEWLMEEATKRLGPTMWDFYRDKPVPKWKLFRKYGWVFDKPKVGEERPIDKLIRMEMLEPTVKKILGVKNED